MINFFLYIALFFGFCILIFAISSFLKRQPQNTFVRLLFGSALILLSSIGLALQTNYSEYLNFSSGEQIANLAVMTGDNNNYQVKFSTKDTLEQTYFLQGNTAELDASILIWQPFMTKFHLQNSYKLEQLFATENNVPSSQVEMVYQLNNNKGMDIKKYAAYLPGIQSLFGSAVKIPLINKAKYAISVNNDGLNVIGLNNIAQNALKTMN